MHKNTNECIEASHTAFIGHRNTPAPFNSNLEPKFSTICFFFKHFITEVALEREMLKRRYELDTLKERQKVRTQHTHRQCAKFFTTDQEFSPQSHFWSTSVVQEQQNHQPEQPKQGHDDGRHQETTEPTGEQTETP